MALQFDPSPYLELFRMKQAQDQANRLDVTRDITQPVLQGLALLQQGKQQNALLDLQKQKAAQEAGENRFKYGYQSQEVAPSLKPMATQSPLFGRQSMGSGKLDLIREMENFKKSSVSPQTQAVQRQFGLNADYVPGVEHYKAYGDIQKSMNPQDVITPEIGKALGLPGEFVGKPRELASLYSTNKSREEAAADRQLRQRELGEQRTQLMDERTKGRYRNYLLDMEQRDPVIKKLREQDIGLRQVDDILSLVNSGNTVAGGALGFKMARAMGEVGVITDQDVVRYVRSGQLAQGAADKLSQMIAGIPTEATREEIAQIANALRSSFKEKIQPRYDQYINSYSRIEGIEPSEFANKLSIPYSGSGGLTPEEAAELAELEKKFGGKP